MLESESRISIEMNVAPARFNALNAYTLAMLYDHRKQSYFDTLERLTVELRQQSQQGRK
jgi:hypothetical protein